MKMKSIEDSTPCVPALCQSHAVQSFSSSMPPWWLQQICSIQTGCGSGDAQPVVRAIPVLTRAEEKSLVRASYVQAVVNVLGALQKTSAYQRDSIFPTCPGTPESTIGTEHAMEPRIPIWTKTMRSRSKVEVRCTLSRNPQRNRCLHLSQQATNDGATVCAIPPPVFPTPHPLTPRRTPSTLSPSPLASPGPSSQPSAGLAVVPRPPHGCPRFPARARRR